MKHFIILTLLMAVLWNAEAQNKLTPAEQKAGWKLLFDGKTSAGWKIFNSTSNGSAWKVSNGELYLDRSTKEGRGDLITEAEYENYELNFEWNIAECGNSGLLFNVIEDTAYSAVYLTGPEMQILDNTCHPDAKIIKHRAGDLYDLISCSTETVKTTGQWNQVRLISNKGNYQFWLNGKNVVNFKMHDAAWDEMIKNSKFSSMPDFGKATKGHLALQDHGDKVSFKNIKIKELK